MNPVRTFDQITQEILKIKTILETITVGILIADGNQASARDYIINYMDMFDRKSGKFMDFVPGYCEDIFDNDVNIERRYHLMHMVNGVVIGDIPIFYIRRNQTAYYFDKFLFDDFIIEMERMGIKYTYNQCLFLLK